MSKSIYYTFKINSYPDDLSKKEKLLQNYYQKIHEKSLQAIDDVYGSRNWLVEAEPIGGSIESMDIIIKYIVQDHCETEIIKSCLNSVWEKIQD